MAAAAPARTAPQPTRRRKPAPARKPATRKPRTRAVSARPATRRSVNLPTPPGGHLIPLAVGRTAVAVRGLPDSGLVVRLTRRRAWIVVLGLLLAGIVALNVATLSFSATAGKIDADIQTLAQENSVLRSRLAKRLANDRVQSAAAAIGLVAPGPEDITYRKADPDAVGAAVRRLSGLAPSG